MSSVIAAISEAIKSIGAFLPEDMDLLASSVQSVVVKRGEHLQRPGEVCRQVLLVHSGSLRMYQDIDGYKEATHGLYVPGSWILDQVSFTKQEPSPYYLTAFEDAEVAVLSMHALHELIGKSPRFFALGRLLEQSNPYLSLESPKERYCKLLNDQPEIVQRFPLKHIASYLQMTPETLSRVRNQLKSS